VAKYYLSTINLFTVQVGWLAATSYYNTSVGVISCFSFSIGALPNKLSVGGIIGITIGSIAFLVGLYICWYCCRRPRAMKTVEGGQSLVEQGEIDGPLLQ
jgi:hypothetical protein